MSFFTCVTNYLALGGIVISLFGDLSYGLARLAGPPYWYSSFPEDVGFLLPLTYSYIAKKQDGQLVFSKRYSWNAPGRFNVPWFLPQLIKYDISFLLICVARLLVPNGVIAKRSFPVMDSRCDHLLTVMGRFH